MQLKLYAIPGSHPCLAVEGALHAKGLRYDRVDLLPGVAPFVQLATFGKRTVPAMRIGDEKVVGSRLIMKALDGLEPEPPLYPHDGDSREAVLGAEQWGDEVLQENARWISVYAVGHRPEAAGSFMTAETNLPQMPDALLAPLTRAIFAAELQVLGRRHGGVQQALAELPASLDRADALIAEGTIGAEPPNAADYQIASSIRLLLTLADIRDAIDARPCGALARRLFPDFPGEVPAGALRAEWLPDLSARRPESTPA